MLLPKGHSGFSSPSRSTRNYQPPQPSFALDSLRLAECFAAHIVHSSLPPSPSALLEQSAIAYCRIPSFEACLLSSSAYDSFYLLKHNMAGFVEQLWESIFTPGPTPSLLLATNVTFASLQLVLLALLIATYSVHFVVLSLISGGLWWAINWFATDKCREGEGRG